jgi:hypothetical protein
MKATLILILFDKPSTKEKEIEGVVIKSNARKETIASTIGLQKNAGVVSQVIGVEASKEVRTETPVKF